MKKIKKFLVALLCLVCSFCMAAFVACTEPDDEDSVSSSQSSSSSSTAAQSSESESSSQTTAATSSDSQESESSTSTSSTSASSTTESQSSDSTSSETSSTDSGSSESQSSDSTSSESSSTDSSSSDTDPETSETEYEWVTTEINYTSLINEYGSGTKWTTSVTSNGFILDTGMYAQSKNSLYCINTQGSNKGITFTLSGTDNYITFYYMAASSSAASSLGLYSVAGDGTETLVGSVYAIPYSMTSWSDMIKISDLAAGTYKLKSVESSARIGELTTSEYLEVSAASSITATDTNLNYLEGDAFSSNALSVVTNYANGSTQTNSDYEVKVYTDSGCTSEADATGLAAGVNYVKVTSTVDGTTFTDTYEINVYTLDSLTLGHNGTQKATSSDASYSSYNGVYYNQTSQKVFTTTTYDSTGLIVIATGKLGSETYDFIISSGYTIDSSALASATTEGNYAIEVSLTCGEVTKTASYNVSYVTADLSYDSTNDIAYIAVDGFYDGVEGAQVQNTDGTYENTFTTIEKALEYLEIKQSAGTITSSTTKQITIAAGYYNEKLEVTLANVHMIGAGSTGSAYTVDQSTTDFDSVTVIEWDSLYGQEDESGYVQVTDSTATFNVRQAATGFYAEGITFSNYYNCVENYANTSHSEHRALAMIIQADQVILKDCALLGYQDTVEFFTGRQYLYNCFISGTTDFIFGTNNTTLFEDCTIYSVTAETSSGATSSDGGYITAFKGCSSGSSDYVTYGAIFYKCTFDAASNVLTNGNTAIARPWGVYAAVAVIECELGSHISTTGHTSGTQKNQRYVTMSGNEPTLETVKFVEYGNTGDGAIDEEVSGMTMLTESAAANYHDYSVIFGTTNGAVTYSSAWTPSITTGD